MEAAMGTTSPSSSEGMLFFPDMRCSATGIGQ